MSHLTQSAATAQRTTDMSTPKTHDNSNPPLADAAGSGVLFEKVWKLLAALRDVKNWNDQLEDKWEDQGYRARAALDEYYHQNTKLSGGNGH